VVRYSDEEADDEDEEADHHDEEATEAGMIRELLGIEDSNEDPDEDTHESFDDTADDDNGIDTDTSELDMPEQPEQPEQPELRATRKRSMKPLKLKRSKKARKSTKKTKSVKVKNRVKVNTSVNTTRPVIDRHFNVNYEWKELELGEFSSQPWSATANDEENIKRFKSRMRYSIFTRHNQVQGLTITTCFPMTRSLT